MQKPVLVFWLVECIALNIFVFTCTRTTLTLDIVTFCTPEWLSLITVFTLFHCASFVALFYFPINLSNLLPTGPSLYMKKYLFLVSLFLPFFVHVLHRCSDLAITIAKTSLRNTSNKYVSIRLADSWLLYGPAL